MKKGNIESADWLAFKLIIACILITSPLFLEAQNNIIMSLPKGIIIDSVLYGNTSESYSLYLPEQYEESKMWPVIFIFDPGARGRIAIEKFVPSGKKFGYILASSNKVRNGNFSDMLTEAGLMYRDVLNRFNVDKRRLITAGFSGASRLATAFATNNKTISGVIGCGAGLPPDDIFYNPSMMSHLSYYGLVGNRDMNYLEMSDLNHLLEYSGKTSFLRVFDGGHEWPSAENIEIAVGWMELQQMKKGVIENRDDFLNDYLLKMISITEESEKASDYVAANRYYSYLLRDFHDSPLLTDLSARMRNVEQTDYYKKGIKDQKRIHDEESQKREIYYIALNDIALNQESSDSITKWWRAEIHILNIKIKKKTADSLMAYRLLNMVTIASVETGRNCFSIENYKLASGYFRIWTICDPGNKNSWYNLARAYALEGKSDEAVFALESSIRTGLSNKETILNDKAFSNILNNSRLKKIITRMK
jgi:hypothetical protein